MPFFVCWLVALLVVAGCSSSAAPKGDSSPFTNIRTTNAPAAKPPVRANVPAPSANPDGPVVRPADGMIGKVVSVNDKLRFVVLDFTLYQLPEPGQMLNVYRASMKVGELKVTGPSRNFTTAADIVLGEAAFGDEVRRN